jgi:hypothetical protein
MTAIHMASKQLLLVTRERGRHVAREMPKDPQLKLDFKGVEVVSPSFLDELIKGIAANGTKKIIFMNVAKSTRSRLELLQSLQDSPSKVYPAIAIE